MFTRRQSSSFLAFLTLTFIVFFFLVLPLVVSSILNGSFSETHVFLGAAAVLSLTASFIVTYLAYQLFRFTITKIKTHSELFGNTLSSRIVALAVVVAIFHDSVYKSFEGIFLFIPKIYRSLSEFLFKTAPSVTDQDALYGKEGVLAQSYELIMIPVNATVNLFQSINFMSLAFALATWVVLGSVFSVIFPGDGRVSLVRQAGTWISSRSPEYRQKVVLLMIFLVGVYLSIAAIAAIPWLTQTSLPEAVSVQKLRERLTSQQYDDAGFDARYPSVLVNKDDLFKNLRTYILDSSGAVVDKNKENDTPKESKIHAAAPEKLGGAEEYVTNLGHQWKTIREKTLERQNSLYSKAIGAFEAQAMESGGVREKVIFFHDLIGWHERELKEIYRDLDQAKREFSRNLNTLQQNSESLLTQLKREAAGVGKQTERLDIAPIVEWASPTDIDLAFSESAPTPNPPTPGLGWGPFGFVSSWLLRTQSLSLALITGMLGVGLLGATASTFSRAEKSRQWGEEFSAEIVGVVIRGFAAAVIVFLAVEGGLAVFGTGTPEPNSYMLLLTCLIGAIFSKDVWSWARNKFGEIFPQKNREP